MDNQYSYYNPNETEGNTSNGTTFYNNGQGDDGKTPKKKKEHKKMPKAVAVTGLALMFGVVSSATFLTTNYVGTKVLKLGTTQKSTSTTSTSAVTSNASLTKTSSVVTSDVSSVVENVMPSIVSITNMSVQEVQNYFGGTSKQESESAGTGIIISQNDSELLVVTNNHVVAGSDTLTVTFADGNSVEANIKGTDSEYDVAVVAVPLDSISEDTKKAISVATLGDSTELKVGEPVKRITMGANEGITELNNKKLCGFCLVGVSVGFLDLFWHGIRDHRMKLFFADTFHCLVIKPAFVFQHIKCLVHTLDLSLDVLTLTLEHGTALRVGFLPHGAPFDELADILDLHAGFFETVDDTQSLQLTVAEFTDSGDTHHIRKKPLLIIIAERRDRQTKHFRYFSDRIHNKKPPDVLNLKFKITKRRITISRFCTSNSTEDRF